MQTKFFVGTRITPDLKNHLGNKDSAPLQQVRYDGKNYLGLYLSKEYPTLQDIRSSHDYFMKTLQNQCPELRVDKLSFLVFPHLFLG